MIDELIIDTTNRCPLSCVYCGTDSNTTGRHLPAATILALISQAKAGDVSTVYLGGGWFFSHPMWHEILRFNRETRARIVIDTPPISSALSVLTEFPMSEHGYALSLSLWGVAHCHDRLSRSDTFRNVSAFLDLMQRETGRARVSFVLTPELLSCAETIASYLNHENRITEAYFHRLMPVGRATRCTLPGLSELHRFMGTVESALRARRNLVLSYHHTLTGSRCRAGSSRLFVSCSGDVYGCGWVGEVNRPAAVAGATCDLIAKVNAGQVVVKHECPLTTT